MTEAMSRHEIEDVLSSIRRLVSHEDRVDHKSGSAAPAPTKLVLTSALRVDGDAAPTRRPSENGGSKDPVCDAVPPVSRRLLEQASCAAPAFADAPVRAPLLARSAQAGQPSVSSAVPDVAAPDAVNPPAATDDAAQPATTEPHAVKAVVPLQATVADNVLETTLARLEEALSITPAAPDQTATDALVDEEALAQIVGKMVRQELQGELGERITRNIRKLVRAEVARELQMRNL